MQNLSRYHEKLRFGDLSKLRTYLSLYLPYKRKLIFAILFVVLKHSVLIVLPLCTQMVLDHAIPEQDFNLLTWILAGMALTISMNVLCASIYVRFKSAVLRNVSRNLRSFLCFRLQQLSISFYDRTHSGKLFSKIMLDVERLHRFGEFIFEPLSTGLFISLVMLSISLYKSPMVTLAVLGIVPLLIIFQRLMRKRLKRTQENLRKANESMSVRISTMIQSLRLDRAHGEESSAMEKVEESNARLANAGRQVDHNIVYMGAGVWSTGQISLLIVLAVASFAAMKQPPLLTLGEVVLFITYFTHISTSLSGIANGYDVYVQGRDALRSMGEIANCPDMENNKGLPNHWDVRGEIKYSNVNFRYPKRLHDNLLSDYALRDVNLHIHPGQKIGLVGHSGSGKSSFINLLLGFYHPESGKILIDGKDINTIDMRSVRSRVGIVSQEYMLFQGSVKDNITQGKSSYSDPEIEEAIKIANAYDFIQALPRKLDTWIGEGGTSLSGGQKQRIAIARAVLRNPAILLLDEATSGLDSYSEKLVKEALEQISQGRTTITIAHRLSTVRNADKILVFDKGKIMETGTHDELLSQKDSHYRELVKIQSFGQMEVGI